MRDIKFKAKALVGDKNIKIEKGNWVIGCFIESGCDEPAIIFGDGCQIQVDRKTLCQFSGFKDSSGSDIYENDVIDLFGDHYTVAVSFGAIRAISKSLSHQIHCKHFNRSIIIGSSL